MMVKCRALLLELLVVGFNWVRRWGGVLRKEGLLRMGCSVFMMGSGAAERPRLQLMQKQPTPAELQRVWGSVRFAQGLFTFSGPR